MTSPEYADLVCAGCGQTAEHELRYAGRLLDTTTCSHCGHVVQVTSRSLLPAYLHDLEQRVTSKPARLYKRARRDPVGFVRRLPRALARQPVKLAGELWSVLRRR